MVSSSSAPTMRELARALGMSVTTVSMALRNLDRVAPDTRRKVQAFARERGYRLNPAVTSLMSRVRSAQPSRYQETLAWLNLWSSPDNFTASGVEYHRDLWNGAAARAAQLGYTLENFWAGDPEMSGRRLSGILAARGIRGLLIPPLPISCGHLSIDWKEFSAVALTYTMARPELHRVVPDHHHNMQLILRALRHRGYRRPGLLMEPGYDERVENRMRSAYYFHQQSLPQRNRVPVLLCRRNEHEAASAAWLREFRPDAVITLGQFRHLRKLDVGESRRSKKPDVVLIGYASTDSGFAAVDENPFQIGATGIDQLAAQLNRNERGIPSCPQVVLIRGTWVEGRSLPGRSLSPPRRDRSLAENRILRTTEGGEKG